MLLITHIILAVTSLSLMVAALIGQLARPSGKYGSLTQWSAITFGGLVATGTALVIKYKSPILGACTAGLVYFGLLAAVYLLYKRFQSQVKSQD
jgi:hypothetical protein